ncbi:MAG TPA: PP2C family protein-serine/threonine phosphatase [Tepidisphaeraceae bacterium]|jgi:sigma-B regulation protein RsbU (phosphoserine phosphatase)|nr:PP2C family protein-serine/threonine phosphatase [Tepidisphaeraceae bacterium]
MASRSALLRLVSDDATPEADPAKGDAVLPLHAQVEAMQLEMEQLKSELHLLRRRDETLNYCMHRIDEELRLAAKLQQDFLPRTMPQIGNVHFHTLYRPAGYVSGDLYDVCRLDEQHVGFWMTDAVGHGMPAALLTMFIKNAFVTKEISATGYRLLTPGETLSRLNEAMVEQNLSQATFATAVYGVVNVRTLTVRYARAGHPLPMLMKRFGEIDMLDADGGLLGIFGGEVYETRTVHLTPGDRLIFYSDGVEVAFGVGESMDTHRWRHELTERRELPTETMLHEFAMQMDTETGSIQPKDDLTIIALEVR